MIIFPAIDIRRGKCVRLYQGKIDQETVYNDDPILVAKKWEENGAKFLHIVDLDGAFTGNQQNKDIIKVIVKAVDIPIQVGGGIRTLDNAKEFLESGVKRVIVGTSAIKKEKFVEDLVGRFGDRIVVSIDAKNGYVCTDGWVSNSEISAVDFAKALEKKGVKTIVYTDISKDGTMVGPNFSALKELKENVSLSIIASGGIGEKKDIEELKRLDIYGAITGKALYEGKIKLEEL